MLCWLRLQSARLSLQTDLRCYLIYPASSVTASMSFSKFKLASVPAPTLTSRLPEAIPDTAAITSIAFQIPDYDPGHATAPAAGSFDGDLLRGYSLRWASFEQMKTWLRREEMTNSIELISKAVVRSQTNPNWITKHVYVCARQGSGGTRAHQKKKQWERKVPTKRVEDGCQCRLSVKSYPGRSEVLGKYRSDHTHPIGDENLRFTRLSEETRAEIERLLRLGVEPKKVVRNLILA